MKGRLIFPLALLALLALPQHAYANAGTPLMWAGILHLALGNLLIGLGEGLLVARLCSVSFVKAGLVIVAANYFSAWLGLLFIRGAIIDALPLDLNNGWQWFWTMVAVTFFLTLLLEWPFIAWCLRGTPHWLKKSLRASVIVQSASYLLLFGWYWMASGTSLYTQMQRVAPAELSLPESVIVYYIDPSDGHVYKQGLRSNDREKVFELRSRDEDERLFARPSALNTNCWELMAWLNGSDNKGKQILVTVLTNQSVVAVDKLTGDARPQGTWFNFGQVQQLGIITNGWTFGTGFWPIEGLRASNERTGETFKFCYETPFGAWICRNAIQLSSDKVLFQLGDNQICALDASTRRVALLWHGRGPVAVIPKTSSAPASP